MSAVSVLFDNFLFALMGFYVCMGMGYHSGLRMGFHFGAKEVSVANGESWAPIIEESKLTRLQIFYFYARYAVLALFVLVVVARSVDHPIDCDILFAFITRLSTTALGAASLNLAIRSMAVWGNDRLVVVGLSILLAGQLAAILRSVPATVGGSYLEGTGCVIISAQADVYTAMYTVTMVVDFVILSLTAYKTYVEYRNMYHSGLIKLIFRD
ncbi:hypothetical protein PQX77_010690, partial [Marasmius sp. AFHP31]